MGIPVVTAGRINSPALADDILRESRADLVAMGRALIADPELPNKTLQGRTSDIRPCIACNLGCFDRVVFNVQDLKCSVNLTVGRRELAVLEPAREPKKVLVIGGGPAGLTAAAVTAKRGHDVSLWEQRDTPGGQVLIAALPPDKEEFTRIVDYLWREALGAGVDVRLGKSADLAGVRELNPDIVILSAGSVPERPSIPGIDLPNVVTASQVLYSRAQGVGRKVVVLGGGEVGCETAAYLASLGKQVTVLRRGPKMADDMGVLARSKSLRDAGVAIGRRTGRRPAPAAFKENAGTGAKPCERTRIDWTGAWRRRSSRPRKRIYLRIRPRKSPLASTCFRPRLRPTPWPRLEPLRGRHWLSPSAQRSRPRQTPARPP